MNAVPNSNERRRHMVQDYSLLWLDECMEEENKDYQNILIQLKTITDNVNVFKQRDVCIDYLTDTQEDIKSFLVVKNTMSQQIMPLINDIPQLHGIYIFDDTKILPEKVLKKWKKIKSVHTKIDDLCEGLQLDIKQYHRDSIAISFVTADEMNSTDNLNQLEPTFMYTQIFKDILLDMEHNKQAIKDFTTYSRQNDCGSTTIIDRFENEYQPHSAIWWYTFTPFIYCMLNDGLRSMEGSTIINMGFFIHDLHKQIQQLHQQQVNSYHDKPFIVYRGQGLSKANFKKLQKTKGGLMSFNNFLSTSMEQDISLVFARSVSETTNMVGILFKILINPRVKSVPFASIQHLSAIEDENEILFSMHSVFRVGAIEQMDNNNELYQVELQLTSDDDQQLRVLTDRIREEASGNSGWERLGNLLLKIGQFNKAEGLYNVLLEQTSDESKRAIYYHQLGFVHRNQADYEKAIMYSEKALEIKQKTLPSNHPDLAATYNNIGLVYENMGEYSKALSFYEKYLEIKQKTLPSNHPDLAASYNNNGSVYENMGEYSKALSYHEKALEIREKTLPSNHPSLATSFNNIGSVYTKIGEYSKALSFYEKALDIEQKTLPSNHPSLATSYNNIAGIYYSMKDCSKALSFYQKALDIKQKALPLNLPLLAISYSNIGLVYDSMGEYSKALSFHKKALDIQQKSLSSNHPSLATSYGNIGWVYENMGEYSKALSFYQKDLEIKEKTLSSNHPDLAILYNNIGLVYTKMGEYSKALSFYEKALDIQQNTLPSNYLELATLYSNTGLVYHSLREYSKALSFYQKALEIKQKTFAADHPDLATSYDNIGSVYGHMGEHLKSLSFYEKALEINQKNLPSDGSNLATSYNNIGWVYNNMKDYSKALSYFERALGILQSALPPTHPYIKGAKYNIEIVKKKL